MPWRAACRDSGFSLHNTEHSGTPEVHPDHWRGPRGVSSLTPRSKQDQPWAQTSLLMAGSRWIWKISKVRDSTASLGSPCQCWMVLAVTPGHCNTHMAHGGHGGTDSTCVPAHAHPQCLGTTGAPGNTCGTAPHPHVGTPTHRTWAPERRRPLHVDTSLHVGTHMATRICARTYRHGHTHRDAAPQRDTHPQHIPRTRRDTPCTCMRTHTHAPPHTSTDTGTSDVCTPPPCTSSSPQTPAHTQPPPAPRRWTAPTPMHGWARTPAHPPTAAHGHTHTPHAHGPARTQTRPPSPRRRAGTQTHPPPTAHGHPRPAAPRSHLGADAPPPPRAAPPRAGQHRAAPGSGGG